MKKILVTSALPYANGSIHLGHLLEAVQTDVYVRHQKNQGNECYYFCADDTHGTAIMLAAKKEGITPEELIERVRKEHFSDLTAFGIHYDNYYTTNSPENREFSSEIYLKLKAKGHIAEREIEQTYCEHDKMFLPDRFIKGTCPKCGAKDQYGDGCEVCGANYNPKDLNESFCAICGNKPTLKKSRHLFVKLPDFQNFLETWVGKGNHLHSGVQKKLLEWFQQGLQEWDISRDGPYFGFEIPGEENKFFYVWLDAPIGYMASSKNYFQKKAPELFDEFWKKPDSQIIHFIGKDILYFHTLFWPAMLHGGDYKTPDKVHVHGFLTVNGEKMSKSRGTFINAATFSKYQNVEHFRFYMASKLNDSLEDIDLNFTDYTNKINADLIGNLVNIFSRTGTSILDKLDRKLGKMDEEGKALVSKILGQKQEIISLFNELNYSKALKEILRLGDLVNKYINDSAPWTQIKTDPEKTRTIITNALNAGRLLMIYLQPVIPEISRKVNAFLGRSQETLLDLENFLEDIEIQKYEPLSMRVEEKAILLMIEESKPKVEDKTPPPSTLTQVSDSGLIKIDDLVKVELRVGHIVEANHVEGADKLVNVKVDLGDKGIKNVFAGIKQSYSPEDLKGLLVVVVANLEPRKMKFGISEAMLLASGSGETLSLFVPHRTAKPGDILK
jgi:methionyl-tRNA synthetase